MAERRIAFRLPLAGWPRAELVTDYGFRGGRLLVDGVAVLRADDRAALAGGVGGPCPTLGATLWLQLDEQDGETVARLTADGQVAPREQDLRPPLAASAWRHAAIASLGSGAGFVAGALYLLKADLQGDPWSFKMAVHMAAWHLLLVLTLFPASIWGGQPGIRLVQAVSLVFFSIHLAIAIANAMDLPTAPLELAIAGLNAASGAGFAWAVHAGRRAHHDMDPAAALAAPR